jgi:putative NADPH-quinone reductase
MTKTSRVLIIQGHPDPAGGHFGHALAASYASGASKAGHELRSVEVAKLGFPLLRSAAEWTNGQPPEAIARAQDDLLWASHLAIFFPLWLGDMPAVLKGFFEQALRPGFAVDERERGLLSRKRLSGRSARLVVTMGMPSTYYNLFYRAHSVKSLKRNILEFCGIGPVHISLLGMIERGGGEHEAWLEEMEELGRKAA